MVSYGDIAELVGCGPRQVGRTLALHGGGVCWWRVTNGSGGVVEGFRPEVAGRWAEEGIQWRPGGAGCRISDYRADLRVLADDWETTLAGG